MKINRTVQRAVDILLHIADHPEGVSLEELCQVLKIPKTSAYDILVTLAQAGMVSVIPGTRQLYQTGIAAYRIGMSYPDANNELKLIRSALKSLAEESDRTAFYGRLSDGQVLYILKEVPENPIITTAEVGSTAPLYCTSLGKVLLSFLPGEETEELLSHMELQPRTEWTIGTMEELRKDLERTRRRGYALDFREYEAHMVCVSAPVYRRDGMLAGAVSISGLYRRESGYDELGKLIQKNAAEISRLLGFHE